MQEIVSPGAGAGQWSVARFPARMNPSIFSHYTFSPTLSSGSIFSNFIYSAGSRLSKSHCGCLKSLDFE